MPVLRVNVLKVITNVPEGFAIRFNYDPLVVEAIKAWPSVPKPRWDGTRAMWLVGTSFGEVDTLHTWATENGFVWTVGATAQRNEILDESKQRIEASQALGSSFAVPGFLGLRPHQSAAVEYATKTKRTLIADDMGLGKSLSSIAAASVNNAYPVIVVTLASLKYNWKAEIEKWMPNAKIQLLSGISKGSKAIPGQDFYVINYDILFARVDELRGLGPRCIIFDESHALKSGSSRRTKSAKKLAKDIEYVFLLTGTPVLNRPIELEPQLEILGRLGDFGGSWRFRQRYCGAIKVPIGWDPKKGKPREVWDFGGRQNLEELSRRLRATCMIRRKKSEVLQDLPDKQRIIIPVDIDTRREYDSAVNEGREWAKGKNLEKGQDFVAGMARMDKLRQIAAQGKLASIKEWTTDFLETGEKIVIFAHHVAVQEEIANLFPGCAVFRGADSIEERDRNIKAFRDDPNVRVIVCSLTAGGFGLNGLQDAASTVLFVQTSWTPGQQEQAEDRLHRMGQKNLVNVYYFQGRNTVEEGIWKMLDRKSEITSTIHDGEAIPLSAGALLREVFQ